MIAPKIIEAAREIHRVLGGLGFPFCLIGGLAVQRWGEPRVTRDVDLTVLTRIVHDEVLVDQLLRFFSPRLEHAREFALRNRVLLLQAENGVGLDVALGALDFEGRAVERSSGWEFMPEMVFRTCSAEDLIVYKAFADRDLDWIDIRGILVRQGEKLDRELIFGELRPLLQLKEAPEAATRLAAMGRKYGGWQ